MKKYLLASLAALVLTLAFAWQGFGVSNIVQSITYSPQVQGFIALIKGDSSRVIEVKPKQYEAGKTYNGVALTVTGTNWTTTRCVFIPYKTVDGAWRLRFNGTGTVSVAAGNLGLTISGITTKNVSGYRQTFLVFDDTGAATISGYTSNATNVVQLLKSSGTTTIWYFSGELELDSKPTWAD